MPADPFASFANTPSDIGTHARFITPSDTADLDQIPKAILVVDGGDVALIGLNAPAAAMGVILPAFPAYAVLPVRPRRILATGTTATQLLAIY